MSAALIFYTMLTIPEYLWQKRRKEKEKNTGMEGRWQDKLISRFYRNEECDRWVDRKTEIKWEGRRKLP